MVQVFDDGRVAISIEPHGGTIRLLLAVPEDGDEMPAWFGGGEFHQVTDEVVKLTAFKADGMKAGHVRLIYWAMLEMRFKWLIAKRTGEHMLPGGEPIDTWPFEGWQRVDLVKQRMRRRGG